MDSLNITHLAQQLYKQLSLNSHETEGLRQTGLNGVSLFLHSRPPQQLKPLKESSIYSPRIVFLFLGAKTGELGLRHFRYDTNHFLVLTSYYPVQCVTDYQESDVLFGMTIELERTMVAELIHDIQKNSNTAPHQALENQAKTEGLACYPMNGLIREQLWALLRILSDAVACSLFGQTHLRELLYAFICSFGDDFLQSWVHHNSQFNQLHRVVEHVNEHFAQDISVSDLAELVAMSPSHFNRVFKNYMADTPMQYLKKIRLNKAQTLIKQQSLAINQIAQAVGYESASQFSREFKRYFGESPKQLAGQANK
ncbi:AraC family transcriptional regulator [Hydromonas duriensis]|nr:helix-turn-helix domain-containing protein [Hydromonas duriensis]